MFNRRLLSVSAIALGAVNGAQAQQYNPPATYYSTAEGQTGATLKSRLNTIVSTGLTSRSYGDARFSAPYTDPNPNVAGNIFLMYNRASVSSAWDSGATWNREHIWPDSRLGPGANDPSAGYVGPASDQFNLRPCNPGVNSSHSNTNFGIPSATGAYGSRSGYWYPGDTDAGDTARSAFYMATRWSHLTLLNGNAPSNNSQMGDLAALVTYHYRDVPDDFERRRNHAIYGLAGENSPAITNPYRQSNRNPYVDRPEYVWSVFVDQQNDSRLTVNTPDAAGGSSVDVKLGRVLVGASIPAAQNVTLTKAGTDGTYYSVTATGAATSTVTGRYNAFAMGSTGSRTIGVGLNTSTATPGMKSGAVAIDNLDVTTQGGAGRGANDANDTINVSLAVLAASNSSFSAAGDTNVLSLDFGQVQLGSTVAPLEFSIANLASASLGADLTARLDLDAVIEIGDTAGVFTTNLAAFDDLPAGSTLDALATLNTSQLGTFAATYRLMFSDEDLPGTIGTTQLTLNVGGTVVVPEPATFGVLTAFGLACAGRRRRRRPA